MCQAPHSPETIAINKEANISLAHPPQTFLRAELIPTSFFLHIIDLVSGTQSSLNECCLNYT